MMITNLKQLTRTQRARLKREYYGFISEVARQVDRNHAQVSRLFNGTNTSKSARIEKALLAKVNQLLDQLAKQDAAENTPPASASKTRRA